MVNQLVVQMDFDFGQQFGFEASHRFRSLRFLLHETSAVDFAFRMDATHGTESRNKSLWIHVLRGW